MPLELILSMFVEHDMFHGPDYGNRGRCIPRHAVRGERAGMSLLDPFGRKINYLRLSVTGRCNFRCGYCMPSSGGKYPERVEILSDEELLLIARSPEGFGGEPFAMSAVGG